MAFMGILAAVSGVISGVGALEQGQAAASADKYNAQVDQQNEKVALEQGQAAGLDQQRKNEMDLGRIQSAYGAAGIDMGGDALGVYSDSASEAAYNMAKVHWDAANRATGYANQAQLDESKAKNDSTAGVLNMFSAGINTGTSILKAG